MNAEDREPTPFFDHLRESEKRLGATRHSAMDLVFMVALAVIIVGGFVVAAARFRALEPQARIEMPAPSALTGDREKGTPAR
jgi:hypothetical protein